LEDVQDAGRSQGVCRCFFAARCRHTRDEIALFPSPVLLPTVIDACKGSNVAVGAQNIHFAEEGAYTGETSVLQLKAVGGTHTLIGHSERRQYFAETDEIVNKKLHTALKHGVVPMVCIGEVLEEREAGKRRAC
jgi:triosephosphate isomerase (TIM)